MTRSAVVTGASSGIGAATARALAKEGIDVVIGARREDRLRALADEIGARWKTLDITDQASVDAFCGDVDSLNVLVNNAGGAKGLEPLAETSDDDWRWMWETNVLGTVRMTRALLPALEHSADGHIVNVGSTAGLETYEGGSGYTSAKHAVRALTDTLRLELLGKPIRVTEIDPGMVGGAEFSVIRFDGDEARAAKVYEGTTPLTPEDVADVVVFAVTRPSHVNLDRIVVRPRDQATSTKVHRRT